MLFFDPVCTEQVRRKLITHIIRATKGSTFNLSPGPMVNVMVSEYPGLLQAVVPLLEIRKLRLRE
jgi:hypothetical protein